MTLKGVVACDANLFVYCFLFVNYYSKILLQFCQLYSTSHFIADMTLYQMLESGKIPRFTDQTTVAMSHTKKLIDTFPELIKVLLLASQ